MAQTQNSAGKYFTSSDQIITAGGALTLAHGLAATPVAVQASLICQTAEKGYSIGDILILNFMPTSNNTGISVVPDSTNLNIRFGSAANTFSILNKTTGANAAATNANWKIRFYAAVTL